MVVTAPSSGWLRTAGQHARGVAALQHNGRAAFDIDQPQGVAGIDQMRILDLRVDLPDLRPIPWIAQEDLGDAPQGIPAFHDVAVRGVRIDATVRRGRHGRGGLR